MKPINEEEIRDIVLMGCKEGRQAADIYKNMLHRSGWSKDHVVKFAQRYHFIRRNMEEIKDLFDMR